MPPSTPIEPGVPNADSSPGPSRTTSSGRWSTAKRKASDPSAAVQPPNNEPSTNLAPAEDTQTKRRRSYAAAYSKAERDELQNVKAELEASRTRIKSLEAQIEALKQMVVLEREERASGC
jgi:hypothetical protein